MKAVNLYTLSRKVTKEILPLYEKSLGAREDMIRIRSEEIDMIYDIVNGFISLNAESYCIDNWFYSFSIPQVSKEFDLLKIERGEKIVNIELKSQEVSLEKIEEQLRKNRMYLSHISRHIASFSCVRINDAIKVYRYDGDVLVESSIKEMLDEVAKIQHPIEKNIEDLFRPRDYLVSPLNTPQKFLEDKYFLNNQQKEIKERVISSIRSESGLWGITGSAGTGKTLLLYDIVKTMSEEKNVGVIHCGNLNEGHIYLNSKMKNVSIICVKELTKEWMLEKDYIFVDETQRMYKNNLDMILDVYSEGNIIACVFSYDPIQVLSHSEENRNNCERLKTIEGFQEECLSNRIRTNKEIHFFVENMIKLGSHPCTTTSYENIDVVYANNVEESYEIIRYYQKKDYKFITYTPSQYVKNNIDYYSTYNNSHQVIGQEFDNVILIIDENFRYSTQGKLQAKCHPNPDYLFTRLFYENVSRTREKLCIIVLNNPDIFEKLLRIKEHCLLET